MAVNASNVPNKYITGMAFLVSRDTLCLWYYIRQLQEDPNSSVFYDITIYCSDGSLPWNRLCLALSLPSCQPMLTWDPDTHEEVAVSIPSLTTTQLKEILETSLPNAEAPSKDQIRYTLVAAKTEQQLHPEQGEQDDEQDKVCNLGESNTEKVVESKTEIETVDIKKEKTSKAALIRRRNSMGTLISNDFADHVHVECRICGIKKPMFYFRAHTKYSHNVTITEYKERFGSELEIVEKVMHQCGLCQELVILDSDHIAQHLRTPGHGITRKEYCDTFMIDSRQTTNEPVMTETSKKEIDDPPETQGSSLFMILNSFSMPSNANEIKKEETSVKLEPKVETDLEMESSRKGKKRISDHSETDLNECLDNLDADTKADLAVEKDQFQKKIVLTKKTSQQLTTHGTKMDIVDTPKKEDPFEWSDDEESSSSNLQIPTGSEKNMEEPARKKRKKRRKEIKEVTQWVTERVVNDQLVRFCNLCDYSTTRTDVYTMQEHMFPHFPNICGYICPVCRKSNKRRHQLQEHIEKFHTIHMVRQFGINQIKDYADNLDANSEEQIGLRKEVFCQINCGSCQGTFYSRERMNLHLEAELCSSIPVTKKDTKLSRVPHFRDRGSGKVSGENGNHLSGRFGMKGKDCNVKPGWLKMESAFKTEDSSDHSSVNVMDFFSACANI